MTLVRRPKTRATEPLREDPDGGPPPSKDDAVAWFQLSSREAKQEDTTTIPETNNNNNNTKDTASSENEVRSIKQTKRKRKGRGKGNSKGKKRLAICKWSLTITHPLASKHSSHMKKQGQNDHRWVASQDTALPTLAVTSPEGKTSYLVDRQTYGPAGLQESWDAITDRNWRHSLLESCQCKRCKAYWKLRREIEAMAWSEAKPGPQHVEW